MAAYGDIPPAAWTSNIVVKEECTNTEDTTVCAAPAIEVFVCPMCGDCLSSQEYLDKHVLDAHAEKPQGNLQCSYCPYRSKKRSNILAHERTHTGDRPFSCPSCNRNFTQKKNLVKHLRVHTGEKPYKCNNCSQQFRDSYGLSRHTKLHLDDGKPHACRYCGRSFRYKPALTTHLMTHMARKRRACDKCGQKYTDTCTAELHEQQMHMDQILPVDSGFTIHFNGKVEPN